MRTISAIAALILVAGSCVALKPGSTGYSATWLSVLGVSEYGWDSESLQSAVAYWRPGLTADFTDTVDGYDGTGFNGATATAGVGYEFDGISPFKYITYGTNINSVFNSDFTFSLWINFDSFSGNQFVFNNFDSDFRWFMVWVPAAGNLLRFGIDDNVAAKFNEISTSILSVDTWFNVSGVRSGTEIIMYINGVEQDRDSISGIGSVVSINPLTIGDSSDTPGIGFPFEGSYLDEIIIFNDALTSNSIYQYYLKSSTEFNSR